MYTLRFLLVQLEYILTALVLLVFFALYRVFALFPLIIIIANRPNWLFRYSTTGP